MLDSTLKSLQHTQLKVHTLSHFSICCCICLLLSNKYGWLVSFYVLNRHGYRW